MFALQKSKSKTSSRHQIAIRGVRDGILMLPNNEYRAILQVSSLNFELRSEEEQDAIIETYESFLNSVGTSLQILIRTREIDMDKYLEDLRERLDSETVPIYRTQLQNYDEFIRSLISNNKILTRHFYIVVPYRQSGKADFDLISEQIKIKLDIINKGMGRLGMHADQLDSLEVLDLFYSFYSPTQAKIQPLTEQALQIIHTALVKSEQKGTADENTAKKLENVRRKLIEPIAAPARKRRQARIERQQELNITFGEQDAIDVLSYSGLEENIDHLCIDGVYMRTLYISGYPFVANSGWLDSLINFNHDTDISYHVHEVSAMSALPKLHRKITELESTKRAMMRAGKIVGSEITDPLESAIELRDKIQRGQEKLFQMAIYVSIRAETLEELNKITKLLEATMSARLFYSKVARYQQLEALQSILPRGEDQLAQKRNLDSSSAALTFPFMSSELVQETGILYGVNKSNNSLVILDRFSLHNANSITFASSGAGKSYTTKVEILRQLMQGTKVIVIDPEREYERLTKSVGGTYIKVSAKSKQKINPFDLATTFHKISDLSEHTQDLTEVIGLMAEGLNSREKAAVDKAILKIYKKAKKQQPLLEDLYVELKDLGQMKLCERLERYISGSLAEVFNSQTNIKLDNRLVVFDIKDLPESLRKIMMLIISNFVKNQVMAKPEKRLLIIDEGWLLLEHEESARFVAGLVRRARKYYLGVSIISQQARDFLKSDYGRAIASQSALRILMRQDTTTIKGVVSEFNLSEYEQSFLLTCERGDALLIADQNHVAVKVVASDKEHPLITTNPAELYAS